MGFQRDTDGIPKGIPKGFLYDPQRSPEGVLEDSCMTPKEFLEGSSKRQKGFLQKFERASQRIHKTISKNIPNIIKTKNEPSGLRLLGSQQASRSQGR